jgi:hypothetical protein
MPVSAGSDLIGMRVANCRDTYRRNDFGRRITSVRFTKVTDVLKRDADLEPGDVPPLVEI